MGQIWLTMCFCKPTLTETQAIFIFLCIIYGCFHTATAEVSRCNRVYWPQSLKHLYLALKKKKLTLELFDNTSLIYIGKTIFRIILSLIITLPTILLLTLVLLATKILIKINLEN